MATEAEGNEAVGGTGSEAMGSETVEVAFRKARPKTDPVGRYPGFSPGSEILPAGTVVKSGYRPLTCDILWERDVAVALRDGTVIYTDVFLPAGGASLPAIVAWSPYGKGGGGNQVLDDFPFRAGVAKSAVSELQKWEAPDPAWWCAHGYAIVNPDARGAFASGGDIQFFGPQEGRDGHDLIEWVAAQEWSNGKVGLAGNSWLAIAQWFIAAERPPHLAAIAPWEGLFDLYRHDVQRGGVPDAGFNDTILDLMCGDGRVEDMPAMVERYPLMNRYWEDKRAKVEQIDVPAYVVASWSNPLHTPGTLEAFDLMGSAEKWLRVHNSQEWPDFYANQDDLRRFFDRYLRDLQNGWEQTPRIRLSVLDPRGEDEVDRAVEAFPPASASIRRLYLDAATHGLVDVAPTEAGRVDYQADDGKSTATFEVTFDRDTEVLGFLSLCLWLEAEGADDMDVFVSLEKLNSRGKALTVPFMPAPRPVRTAAGLARRAGVKKVGGFFWSGPRGRLRVSHREIDPARSAPARPFLTHRVEERLAPGQIVPIEVSLGAVGMRWRRGERLRITVAGYDLTPLPMPGVKPPELRNRGRHVIHCGGSYDSALLLPVVN
jgi:predicted acyl esterase